MRKNYLLILVLISATLFSCRKDYNDSVFDKPSEQRVKEVLDAFQKKLLSAPNGWEITIYPDSGKVGGYSFWMKFDDKNRVTMSSDWNDTTTKQSESSYRLKQMQQPSLIFDTYSYVHIIADPSGSINGGGYGVGLKADFEFGIDAGFIDAVLYGAKDNPDEIKMKGKLNNSLLTMKKAADPAYIDDIVESKKLITRFAQGPTYFKRMTLGGQPFDVAVDIVKRVITFTGYNGTKPYRTSTTYNYTSSGMELFKPFEAGGEKISFLSDGVYSNTGDGEFTFKYDGGKDGKITGLITPIAVDPDAARYFYNTPPGQSWRARSGVTVAGIQDAMKVPDYTYAFYPLGSIGGIPYDTYGYAQGTTLYFLLAFNIRFTPENLIAFDYLGTLGTLPTQYATLIRNTGTAMNNANGFYAIRTGDASFDLVSSKDARLWIPYN